MNIVNEIFVKSVKKRIIAFPNLPEHEQHFKVIHRIVELLAVIAPLFPFSGYHIAGDACLKWPEVRDDKFYERLGLHDEMIRLRVRVVNKMRVNRMKHVEMRLDEVKEDFGYGEKDLEMFFNVDRVRIGKSFNENEEEMVRQCSLRMATRNSMTPSVMNH